MNRTLPSCTIGTLLIAATIAVAPQDAVAAKRPADVSIVATEVTTTARNPGEQAPIISALRTASDEEARYYDSARTPVVLRVRIKKVSYKSAGKALAGSLPFVGLLAGSNRNALKGDVEIIDQASGKPLEKFKIEADDDTFFSAGDTALSLGKTGLSFLPFGMLISDAVDVAQGAANHRAASDEMLSRGFVMLSYRKVFGDQAYKSFAAQRKVAWVARKAKDHPSSTGAIATPVAAGPAIAAATIR